MNKRLQRNFIRGAGIIIVFYLVCAGALGTQVRFIPLIDVPGASQYLPYLERVIPTARTSIDVLMSDGELVDNPLWGKIVAAANRGVAVRVMLDKSNWSEQITEKNRPTIDFLTAHGVAAKFDDATVTTHAKLIVIDGHLVILGSSNWNGHAFTDQAQANIAMDDPQVAAAFTTYFDRIWAGTLIPGGVKLNLEELNDGPTLIPIPDGVDTGNYARILLALVNEAKESIHVVMYRASYYPTYRNSLSNNILNALSAAAGRGVEVKVLFDDCAFYPKSAQANREAAYYLADHGIAVRFDDPSVTTHAKLVIIDQRNVILGSTNWNYYSLEKNNEADIAVIGIPSLASTYERFFTFTWNEGQPVR